MAFKPDLTLRATPSILQSWESFSIILKASGFACTHTRARWQGTALVLGTVPMLALLPGPPAVAQVQFSIAWSQCINYP